MWHIIESVLKFWFFKHKGTKPLPKEGCLEEGICLERAKVRGLDVGSLITKYILKDLRGWSSEKLSTMKHEFRDYNCAYFIKPFDFRLSDQLALR